MRLVIGLGNPGEKYQGTRHNLGFEVAEKLASRVKDEGLSWSNDKKFKSEIIKINLPLTASPLPLILAKPQTYMNNSGQAVKLLVDYYKIPLEEVVVIHDDLDLPIGKIKIRGGGAAAGHHGVESIINALGSDKFIRVRLGIAPTSGRTVLSERKKDSFNVEHFVLEPFLPSEKSKIKHLLKRAVEALETLLEKGLETAQNQYN